MPLSFKRMLELRVILTCRAVMCCFHVSLLSTRTPRNLAVVVCSIGTLAMEAEKEDKFNFMLEKIMYLVFLTFNDSPLRLTQSTSASARTLN